MGITAGELTAYLRLDAKHFQDGLESNGGRFTEMSHGLVRTATTAALGITTALVGAVAAFGVESVKHMEDAGHAAHEMADKFGLLPTQASAWLVAANAVGVGSEEMSTGFKFAAKNMETLNLHAQTGAVDQRKLAESTEAVHIATEKHNSAIAKYGKNSLQAQESLLALQRTQDTLTSVSGDATAKLQPLAEAYKALGVNVYDAHGALRPLNDLMLDAADQFAKMPDGAEKAGLAVKLFGRNGVDLIPILNEGRKGIQDYMDAGRASGAVMSNEQVAAAQKLFLAHKQLDQAVAGVANKFGTVLMPIATQLIGWIMSTAIPGLEAFWAKVQKILPPIEAWAKQMWEQVKPALQDIMKRSGDFIPILEAVGIVLGVIIIVLANVIVGLVRFLDWILQVHDAFMDKWYPAAMRVINDTLVPMATAIGDVVRWFRDLITAADNAASSVAGAFSALGGNPIVHEFLHLAGVPGFALGGIVPGPVGAPMLAVVHGGERVLTPAQQATATHGPITVNVQHSDASPRQIARALAWELKTA